MIRTSRHSLRGAAAPPCAHTQETQEEIKGAATYSQKKRGREKTWQRKNSNVLPGKSLIPPQVHHMTFPKKNATHLRVSTQAPISFSDYLTYHIIIKLCETLAYSAVRFTNVYTTARFALISYKKKCTSLYCAIGYSRCDCTIVNSHSLPGSR